MKEIKIEEFAKKYYEEKGFKVYKANTNLGKKIVNHYLKEIKIKFTAGIPDLILIDKEEDWEFAKVKFIEVKSAKDSIRVNQAIWANNNYDNIRMEFAFFILRKPTN